MIHSYISQAILSLRPGAQITIDNDDSSQITVHDDTVLPPDDELLAECNRLDARQVILNNIETLESEVTQRRLRDAYADSTWMDAQEAKIAVERAKL
jgi:hypothetical protein